MRIRRIRQHISEFFRRDWLEGSLVAFGVLAFLVGVLSVLVVVYLIMGFNDDSFFTHAGPTFRRGLAIIGMLVFGSLAGVALIGSWGLVGKRIARAVSGRHRDT